MRGNVRHKSGWASSRETRERPKKAQANAHWHRYPEVDLSPAAIIAGGVFEFDRGGSTDSQTKFAQPRNLLNRLASEKRALKPLTAASPSRSAGDMFSVCPPLQSPAPPARPALHLHKPFPSSPHLFLPRLAAPQLTTPPALTSCRGDD